MEFTCLQLCFFSAANLVTADYGFTCPPRFMSVVVCLLFGPIEPKLGGDLGLVSQISLHVLISRFDFFVSQHNSVWLTMILIGSGWMDG
jgi:hypothetical protein